MNLHGVDTGPEQQPTLTQQLYADAITLMDDAAWYREIGQHSKAEEYIARAEALRVQAKREAKA